MTLIICEKHSVAKSFATALGASFKNGYYQNDNYIITNSIGHLFELYMPEDYNPDFKKWTLATLPIIPNYFNYKIIKNVKKQSDLVLKLLKKNRENKIIIATDAGREGELIGRLALKGAGFENIKNVFRFWESASLTKEIVLKGLKDAKPLCSYNHLAKQGYARQHADWLVGINISRFLSITTGSTMPVGRVQTAVLHEIYSRENKIKNFIPKPYYEYVALLNSNNLSIDVKKYIESDDNQIITKFNDPNLDISDCINKKPIVIDNSKNVKKQTSEKLFNLTALEKKAFKLYSLSPDETLKIAQKLYEEYKCLSYPRTPSRVMGKSDLCVIKEIFDKFKILRKNYISEIDYNSFDKTNKKIFNDALLEDHHALIPLKDIPNSATELEKGVFELIVKQFFMVLSKPYVYEELKYFIKISNHSFLCSGTKTIQKGWRFLASLEAKNNDKNERDINNLDSFDFRNSTCKTVKRLDKQTKPKPSYKMDTLLTFMENPKLEDCDIKKLVGLGTPVTRSEVIKLLFLRKYIIEEGKEIKLSDKGCFLINQLKKNKNLTPLIDVSQTTKWEEEMASDPNLFLDNIKNFVSSSIKKINVDEFDDKKNNLGICPICNNKLYESKTNFYCSGYKNGCKFVVWKNLAGATVSAKDLEILLSGKKTSVKKCKTKKGKEFKCKFAFDEKQKIKFIFE